MDLSSTAKTQAALACKHDKTLLIRAVPLFQHCRNLGTALAYMRYKLNWKARFLSYTTAWKRLQTAHTSCITRSASFLDLAWISSAWAMACR